jgi:hypothetical protein
MSVKSYSASPVGLRAPDRAQRGHPRGSIARVTNPPRKGFRTASLLFSDIPALEQRDRERKGKTIDGTRRQEAKVTFAARPLRDWCARNAREGG